MNITCDNRSEAQRFAEEFPAGVYESEVYRRTWVPRWWPFRWPAKSVFLGTAEVTLVNEEEA